jgi:transketolase
MKINKSLENNLKKKARQARELLLRASASSHSVHIGSSLSEIEILIALYNKVLKISAKKPNDPNRDRFILSKGHAGLGLYTVLSEQGFIPRREILNYTKDGTKLAVHPVYHSAPGLEATSGSLGHGLPIGLGMALSAKRDKKKWRTFVLLSDGECDEGSTWEAILLAGHLKLDNLVAIVDYNKIQSFGRTKEILDLEPFAKKWQVAGWSAIEINGHNFGEILKACSKIPHTKGKPTVVIAHTIKGKGLSHMENTIESHYMNVSPEELEDVIKNIKD